MERLARFTNDLQRGYLASRGEYPKLWAISDKIDRWTDKQARRWMGFILLLSPLFAFALVFVGSFSFFAIFGIFVAYIIACMLLAFVYAFARAWLLLLWRGVKLLR